MVAIISRFADEDIDPKRRALLVAALRAGVLSSAASTLVAAPAAAAIFGKSPRKLPPGQSIYSLRGDVTVNNEPASLSTTIRPGDTVATGQRSQVIFVVDDNAHILRQNSHVGLPGQDGVSAALRVVTGVLLSVFGRRKLNIATGTATIGIRGTGVYVESDPDESYICTCYGTADLIPLDATEPEETVVSEHHDAPRYATRTETGGKRIRTAPFKNHTDLEVALIEELVGRVPPFSFTLDRFDSPIKSY